MTILAGPILADEAAEALRMVRDIPGVQEVVNNLEVHADPDGVTGLQGDSFRSHEKPEILRESWSPSLRLLVGLSGISAMAGSALVSGPRRPLLLGTGTTLLIRSWRNRTFFGRGSKKR